MIIIYWGNTVKNSTWKSKPEGVTGAIFFINILHEDEKYIKMKIGRDDRGKKKSKWDFIFVVVYWIKIIKNASK